MSDSKRRKLESILDKLQKLLRHLGNANVNEATVVLQKINNLLASVGLDWHDLTALLVEKEPSLFELFAKLFTSDADMLIRLGLAGAKFFHSDSATFADVDIGSHRNTWPLSSSDFFNWLLHQFFIEMRKAPSLAAMKSAIWNLSAHAQFEGAKHDVFLRVAKYDQKIYLDIGDPEWHVVEIDRNGWRMIDDSPVRFRRTEGMRALPIPARGGSIAQLRPLVNLTDDGFILYVSCILDAFYPGRPHPVMFLVGEDGAAKSTAAMIARNLVDPNGIPLRSLPTTVEELFVSANGAHTMVFDNVSSISPAISDALCQVSTGTGFGRRRRYTDTAQSLIGGSRSVTLTGLTNVINRSDLSDRAVVIQMQRVKDERRHRETEILNRLESDRGQIVGALLDSVSLGMRNLPNVRMPWWPRMADFAAWAIACSPFEDGVFIKAFQGAAAEATEAVAEDDAVVVAVAAFMTERSYWSGTAAGLLGELSNHDRAEAAPSRWKTWPREVSSFGKRLRRAMSVLGKLGIEVDIGKASDRRRTRMITLRKIEATDAPELAPDTSDTSDTSDASDASDRLDTGARSVKKRAGARSLKKRAGRRRHPRARAVR